MSSILGDKRGLLFLELKDYFFISLGVVLYSLGVTLFMLPYGLTTGGVAGISSIIYYATGVEIQVTYIAINAVLLVVAIRVLGMRFCLKTIYAVLLLTFVLWLFQRIIEVPDELNEGAMKLPRLIGEESFMACVLGAIICGVGLAVCFENNGSTGGTDIIAAIVSKYRAVTLGSVIMACDVVIISSCYFVFHDWFRVIYGFVMLFTCSMTLDYCIRRRRQSVQFMIFSRNPAAIADAIVKTGHGATMLDGTGWYTHTDRKVVISIIRQRDQAMIQRMIKQIDPYAFVSLSDASEVWGEGFDKMKVSSKQGDNRKVLVFATNSARKLAEARAIFGDRYDVRSLSDIGCHIDIPENESSLQNNALLKARFVKQFYGFDCVADDTALECKALGGLPGIYSRNYATADEEQMRKGENSIASMAEWDEQASKEMLEILHNKSGNFTGKMTERNYQPNVAKLLADMESADDRSATIHTVIVFITGDYEDHSTWRTQTFEGMLNGTIAKEASSDSVDSFFYDSVFIPDGFDCTCQELSFDVKNHISQRAIAISKLKASLESESK